MTKSFLGAGVLIAAVRGNEAQIRTAVAVLRDPSRIFVASAFLRLELLPKALFFREQVEAGFCEDFFARATIWADPIQQVVEATEQIATQHGLNVLEALLVAAAIILGADELVTTEGVHKPIHRGHEVRIISI